MAQHLSLKPLDQQVIVITGASSGIGLATAQTAVVHGARVVLAARSEATLHELVDEITRQGGRALAVPTDVADTAQISRLADVATREFGRIDTWVNDAGVSIYGKLIDVSEEDSRRLFDINFWGLVNGSLIALRHLQHQGGAIINLGSEVSDAVIPLQTMYSASKHAVKGFTDGLRLEIQADNLPVSVTLIQPTAVNTPYPQHARNYLDHEAALPSPLIDPQQVADAILDAAVNPRRDVTVGMMAKLNTTVAKLAPAVGDMMAVKQIPRQQRKEAPHNPEGTLYQAGEGGEVRGDRSEADLSKK